MGGCWVPFCNSGYESQKKKGNPPKRHFFEPKTEENRKKWEAAIKRGKVKLKLNSKVCSLHFKDEDMNLTYRHVINGQVVEIPRDRASLNTGAVPCIFPEYPKVYQPKITERKPPAKRSATTNTFNRKKKKNEVNGEKQVNKEQVNEDQVNEEKNTENTKETPADELVPIPSNSNESEQPPSSTSPNCEWTYNSVDKLNLPPEWVICNTVLNDRKVLAHINSGTLQIDKSITFIGAAPPTILFRGNIAVNANLPGIEGLVNIRQAQKLVNSVHQMHVCQGTGEKDKPFSLTCAGAAGTKGKRCSACVAERERLRKIKNRFEKLQKRKEIKIKKRKSILQSLKRSKLRLIQKVERYRKMINRCMQECSKKKIEVVNAAISDLPPAQQEAVRACFAASSKKGPSGRRYTIQWVYECMLMRIKSPKLYNDIKQREILPVPCYTTIRGYIKNFSGAFGFQPSTFDLLKTKTAEMQDNDKHGVILIDEMKLTPGVHFDVSTLKVEGFVDFGEEAIDAFGEQIQESVERALESLPHDPSAKRKRSRRQAAKKKNENKRDKNLGDHALVISFQPFKGQWYQNLACFLTKNNANDDQLTKLVLEAVVLAEASGLYVDGVVTDGATWNRSMWTKFGINEETPTAEHPCDSQRRLFFISDFPHLLKCMRNCLVEKKIIETPEGDIKLKHWEAVVKADSIKQVGLRECPRLTEEHCHPDNWAKMRCGLAWQFWSNSAAAGMASYQFQGVDDLEDCDASMQMCSLVNEVADTMNSRIPSQALRPNSPQIEVLERFLEKLKRIQTFQTDKMQVALLKAEEARVKFLQKQGKNSRSQIKQIEQTRAFVFSDSTDIGLVVTLKGTIQLLEYLTSKCSFKYLMTARLNQDALERFFGLMRQSCGPNTHPEPKVFAQLFRLLSIYSLVKPIRGSNITGGNMLTTLLNLDDLKSKNQRQRKEELERRLDEILLQGENLDYIADLMQEAQDHNYLEETIDEFALSYVAGFTARTSQKFTNDCAECIKTLKKSKEDSTDVDMLINLKSRGYLTYPTDELTAFLRKIERQVVSVCKNNELEENILFLVVEALEKIQDIPLVGCSEHMLQVSKSVMRYYLMMRMHFVCKQWNKVTKEQKKQQKSYRKRSHLT